MDYTRRGSIQMQCSDRHGQDYIGLNIEIQPGYDRFVQSADPAIQAQLFAANRGDLVRIVGVVKGGGNSIRILSYTLVKAAVSALELVQTEAPDLIAA
jgi:hypothetical protein